MTKDEVAAAADNTGCGDLAATARGRRATFADFAELPAPNRVVTSTVPDPFARSSVIPSPSVACAPSRAGSARDLHGHHETDYNYLDSLPVRKARNNWTRMDADVADDRG